MKTYLVHHAASDWDFTNANLLEVDIPILQAVPAVRMTQRVVYNESALFVSQCAWEAEVRAEVKDPLGAVCEDSCMEFFFSPMPSDSRYFNVEVNPLGNVFLGFGRDRHSLVRLFPQEKPFSLEIRTSAFEGGWRAEYKFPAELIDLFFPGYKLHSGQSIRANCYKCSDKSKSMHYLAWNPITSADEDFHAPWDFGSMLLE